MFDIGFWELVVIGVVALVVFGPERLPQFARRAGYWIGRLRRQVGNLRNEIEREIALDEMRKTQSSIEEPLSDLSRDIRRTTASLDQSIDLSGATKPSAPDESQKSN